MVDQKADCFGVDSRPTDVQYLQVYSFSILNLEAFDIRHALLTLSITKLSTLRNSLVILIHPILRTVKQINLIILDFEIYVIFYSFVSDVQLKMFT